MDLHFNYIHIFTDGASMIHKSKVGGWSAVMIYREKIKEIYGANSNSTNNQMELKACIKALERIKTTHIPIKVYSDSSYVVDGMNEWRFNWQINGWKSNKKNVKNRDLWEELITATEKQDEVEFVKVKGHAGVQWNERADELCSIAIEEFLSERRTST